MRWSQTLIPTLREEPQDAEIASHRLMLRAGLIRRLAGGLYTFLPLGLRALRNVERIVREEMDSAGAIELLMPALQPRELWDRSGRFDTMSDVIFSVRDRQQRDMVLGPTHEEVITDLVAREIKSYRQLPRTFYQIQTKFRDEIRPRFGLMRAKEFIMKDAYSFDLGWEQADASYEAMYSAYARIFDRCGLRTKVVEADTGAMGGKWSHEFMVLAETGEDGIVECSSCHYAANLERAERSFDTPEEAAGKRGVNKPYYPNHIWDPVARQWRPKTPEEAGESDMQPMAEPGPGGGAGPGAGPGATGGASPGPSGPGPGPDGKLPPGVPSDDEAPGDGAPLPGYTPGGVKPGAGGKPGSGGSKSWRYYAGPHLSKAAEDLGTAAKALLEYASPGADIKDAADASRRAEEAFRGGDYAKAATEFGNAGLSALGVLIPGTTKGYRKAGEKAGEALSDALSARRAAPRAANNPPKPDVPLTKRNEEAFKDRYDDWWKSQGHTLDAARKADPNRRVAPGESFIWQNLERGKDGRTRTNGVSGKNALHFSFDHGGGGRHHSEIEVFDSRGRHLGTIDPLSGEWIGDAVKGRKMDMSSLHDGNNTRYV